MLRYVVTNNAQELLYKDIETIAEHQRQISKGLPFEKIAAPLYMSPEALAPGKITVLNECGDVVYQYELNRISARQAVAVWQTIAEAPAGTVVDYSLNATTEAEYQALRSWLYNAQKECTQTAKKPKKSLRQRLFRR